MEKKQVHHDRESIISPEKVLEKVRSIVALHNRERITIVTRKGYSSIIMDNNNHRSLCKIYYDSIRKSIGVYNDHNVQTRYKFSHPNDIVLHASEIHSRVGKFS